MPRICPACSTAHDGWRKCPADASIIVTGGGVTSRVLPPPRACGQCAALRAENDSLKQRLAALESAPVNAVNNPVNTDEPVNSDVNTVVNSDEARKAYRREWTAKDRAAKRARNA